MEEAPNDVESCKMHSEDEKAAVEKNRKRTVKTHAQVEELEKFYSEHRYPTEPMKMQVAEAIGLTEKQVSGWFCHRRLKDKRLQSGDNNVTGKQDRSSGVIQDRGSGQRQDSCGSTKQGDGRNFNDREVESGRLTLQESSAVELRYENGGHYSGNKNHMDDTSSGSSSSLRDMSNHQGDPLDVATSRYLIPKFPMDVNGVKARRGPSGYLKVKGQVENSAITAVKRQLGKHYRGDGPPLGVEFDPLPPGAFEDSMQNPVDETNYIEEATLPVSPEFSNIPQHFKFGKGSEYSLSRGLLDSNIDRTNFRTPQVYAGDRSGSESRDDYKMKYTHDFQVTRTNSVPNLVQPSGVNSRRERKPSFRKYNDVCRNSSKGEYELSDLPIKGSEYPNSFNAAQISKDGKAFSERITNEIRATIPYKTDISVSKKMRGEFWKKTSLLDNQTGTNRAISSRGVAAEMPSSFTEDDGSAQTSCSVE
ncbi:hypothetical protein ACS0TY_005326 [Phlomoides rotata]